jgi:hypothetical protein
MSATAFVIKHSTSGLTFARELPEPQESKNHPCTAETTALTRTLPHEVSPPNDHEWDWQNTQTKCAKEANVETPRLHHKAKSDGPMSDEVSMEIPKNKKGSRLWCGGDAWRSRVMKGSQGERVASKPIEHFQWLSQWWKVTMMNRAIIIHHQQ